MSIHQSRAHMLANSTAVASPNDLRPMTPGQRFLVKIGVEMELRPTRLLAVAITSVLTLCTIIAWLGYGVLSPALGGEWGARLAGVTAGLLLGIPPLVLALQKAR